MKNNKSKQQKRRSLQQPVWDSLVQDHQKYRLTEEEMEVKRSQRVSQNHIRIWHQLEEEQQRVKERERKIRSSIADYIAKKHATKQEEPIVEMSFREQDQQKNDNVSMDQLEDIVDVQAIEQQNIAANNEEEQENDKLEDVRCNTSNEQMQRICKQEMFICSHCKQPLDQESLHQDLNNIEQVVQSMQVEDQEKESTQQALIEKLEQMGDCLDNIRQHQAQVEQNMKNFASNIESKVENLNTQFDQMQANYDGKFEEIQKSIRRSVSSKDDLYSSLNHQQSQLTQQLKELQQNLGNLKFSKAIGDDKENVRNYGAQYRYGSNLPLGPVLFDEECSEKRIGPCCVPLMSEHMPIGRAFSRDLDPQNNSQAHRSG